MDCKYKNRLNDYNFCLVACAYCTLEQQLTCKRKITTNDNAPTIDIKTEVARKIFAEIDIPLQRFMNEHDYSIGNLIFDVTELENKYTKEGVK